MSSDYFYNFIAQAGGVSTEQPFFDPNFLNVEYFFNLVFRIFDIFSFLSGFGPGSAPPFLRSLFWMLAFMLVAGIIYAFYKYKKVEERRSDIYWEAHYSALESVDNEERNERWQKVLGYRDSLNESDWRQAIIEADSILGEMLERMRIPGESIGEKLKGIERSDFLSLEEAWEGHKIRNRIAHEGTNFRLSKREVERVVSLYKKIFEEFHYI